MMWISMHPLTCKWFNTLVREILRSHSKILIPESSRKLCVKCVEKSANFYDKRSAASKNMSGHDVESLYQQLHDSWSKKPQNLEKCGEILTQLKVSNASRQSIHFCFTDIAGFS